MTGALARPGLRGGYRCQRVGENRVLAVCSLEKWSLRGRAGVLAESQRRRRRAFSHIDGAPRCSLRRWRGTVRASTGRIKHGPVGFCSLVAQGERRSPQRVGECFSRFVSVCLAVQRARGDLERLGTPRAYLRCLCRADYTRARVGGGGAGRLAGGSSSPPSSLPVPSPPRGRPRIPAARSPRCRCRATLDGPFRRRHPLRAEPRHRTMPNWLRKIASRRQRTWLKRSVLLPSRSAVWRMRWESKPNSAHPTPTARMAVCFPPSNPHRSL